MNARTLLDVNPSRWPEQPTPKDQEPRTFCVRYRDGKLCTALIEAADFEDVEGQFYSAGYKGRIISVRLAD
jgi:hypothetical protein